MHDLLFSLEGQRMVKLILSKDLGSLRFKIVLAPLI